MTVRSTVTTVGFNPPFLSGGNLLSPQENERLIKNDLLQLLLTSPGERVMRPAFGSPIREFVFENSTPAALNGLVSDIRTTIESNDQRVRIDDIIIDDDPDRNAIFIKIYFSLVINPTRILDIEIPVFNRDVDLQRVER